MIRWWRSDDEKHNLRDGLQSEMYMAIWDGFCNPRCSRQSWVWRWVLDRLYIAAIDHPQVLWSHLSFEQNNNCAHNQEEGLRSLVARTEAKLRIVVGKEIVVDKENFPQKWKWWKFECQGWTILYALKKWISNFCLCSDCTVVQMVTGRFKADSFVLLLLNFDKWIPLHCASDSDFVKWWCSWCRFLDDFDLHPFLRHLPPTSHRLDLSPMLCIFSKTLFFMG